MKGSLRQVMEHVDNEPFDGKMNQKLIEWVEIGLSNSAILTTMGKMDFVERTFFRPNNVCLHDLPPERCAVSPSPTLTSGNRACVHMGAELPAVQGRRRFCSMTTSFQAAEQRGSLSFLKKNKRNDSNVESGEAATGQQQAAQSASSASSSASASSSSALSSSVSESSDSQSSS